MNSKTTLALTVGITSWIAVVAEELPETVISASRTEELLKNSPYAVSVIGADELLDGSIRSLPEALKNTPGVMIQKTTHGHGSPYIRGFTGRQNLLLVDGIRINNSTFRDGPVQYWNTVDSSAVDRLELVKGPGSVLYGSDAIGGTLNTLTRSSNFREYGDGWFNSNTAYYRYDTNSGSHVGRLESAFGQGGKWGVLLGVTNKNFGDIKDSAVGRMKNTGYDELDLDFKFDYAVSDAITLTLTHQSIDQDDVWRWHRTRFNKLGWRHGSHVTSPGSFNAEIYDQERSLTYLKLAGEEAGSWLKKWSAVLSFQKTQDSTYQDRKAGDIRTGNIDLLSWGLGVNLESDLGPGSLVYGFDYYHDEVDATGTRTGKDPRAQRPLADDSSYDLIGLFAQYRWSPAALPKLETTMGARYTYANAHLGKIYDSASDSDIGSDMDWDNLVISGRVLYRANDCWNLYGGISQGFRAPNLHDLSGNTTSRSGLISVGSLDVEPEKFLTYEIGTKYEADKLGFAVAVYYTDIESVITNVPATSGSSTTITTNAQDGFVYGVEASGELRLSSQWKLQAQASWQDGQTDTVLFIGGPGEEDYISRIAPLMGSVGLRWTHPDGRLWIEGRVSAAAKADHLSNGDEGDRQRIPTGGTPSYVVGSLYAGWQATDSLLLTLGLENLTDEDYRIHGSGQNETGFNAIIGARVAF